MDGSWRYAFVSAGGVRVAGDSDRVLVVDDFLFRAVHVEAVRFAHGIVDQGRLGHKFVQFGHRSVNFPLLEGLAVLAVFVERLDGYVNGAIGCLGYLTNTGGAPVSENADFSLEIIRELD